MVLACFAFTVSMAWGQSPANGGFEATLNGTTDWTVPSGCALSSVWKRTGSNSLLSVSSNATSTQNCKNATVLSLPNLYYGHVIAWAIGTNSSSYAACLSSIDGGTSWQNPNSSNISTTLTQLTATTAQNTTGNPVNFKSGVCYKGKAAPAAASQVYFDDVIMYVDNLSTVDITPPSSAASSFTLGTVTTGSLSFSWTNGSDAGTGIQNTIILRTSNMSASAPTLNSQAIYANSIVVSTDWTVLNTIAASTTSYTDNTTSASTNYKYAIIQGDKAYNYSAAYVSGQVSYLSAPALIAAPSASVDAAFDVTFTDNSTWRTAITSVTVGGTTLSSSAYSVSSGKITFTPSLSTLLQSSGPKSITIIANGYANATVSQTISVGAATKLGITTQPTLPATNGAALGTQPVVAIQDQYGNTTTSTAAVLAAASDVSWTIGGTTSKNGVSGVAAFTDLTATSTNLVSGATISFTSTGLTSVTSNGFIIPSPNSAATKLVITSISTTTPTAGTGFSVTVQSQDDNNIPINVSTGTGFSLTTNGTAGSIGGTTSGTITSGSNSVTISGVTLSAGGTGVTLTATRTGGDALAAGTSASFNVYASIPTQVSVLSASGITASSINLGWTNGNGAARIVVARLNATSAVAPTIATNYACISASFADGTNATTGTGNVVVYNGTGNSVTVTGLSAATAYNFDVYEYNGTTSTYNYTTAVSTGSNTTLAAEPTTQATAVTFSSVAGSLMTIACTKGNGANRIILMKAGSAVDSNPVDGTAYTANVAFGSGTQIGTGNYVVYSGTANTAIAITGLTGSTTYYVAVYEYNGTTGTYNYLTTSPATSSQLTLQTANSFSDLQTQFAAAVATGLPKSIELGAAINVNSDFSMVSTGDTITINMFSTNNLIQVTSGTLTIGDKIKLVSTQANAFSAMANGTIIVNSGCNLTSSATAPINTAGGNVTINGGKIITTNYPAATAGSSIGSGGTLIINGGYLSGNGATLARGVGIDYLGTCIINGGVINVNNCVSGRAVSINATGGGGKLYVYGGTLTATGVPDGRAIQLDNNNSTAWISGSPTLTGTTAIMVQQAGICVLSGSPTINGPIGTNTVASKLYDCRSMSAISATPGSGTYYGSPSISLSGASGTIYKYVNTTSQASATSVTAVIKETTDGSTPVSGSTTYSTPLVFTTNTTLKAAPYIDASIIGLPSTFSYSVAAGITLASDNTASALTNCINCDLSIPSGLTLTVDAPKTFNSITVDPGGKLTNTGTLTATTLNLNSNATGTATYVDNGTTTVTTANVQQYLPQGRNWYVSSPIAAAAYSVLNTGTSVVQYNEATGAWDTETGTLTPMRGYISVSASGTGTSNITFSGALNTGSQSISLTRSGTNALKPGFNLVGNPYPSFVNIRTAINNNPNLDKTIWYRTKDKDNTAYHFDTYNTVSAVGTNNNGYRAVIGTIPPMQAVWVRVSSGNEGATLTLDNTLRSHKSDTINPFKVKALKNSDQQKLLRLQVSNGTNSDEAILLFNSAASNGLDDFDSFKMTNSTASIPEIFTTVGSEQLVINGLKNIPYNTELPVGFTTGQANTFTIKASEISNFDAETHIIIKDNQTNTEQDLTDGMVYSFNSDATTSNTRFSLIFKTISVVNGINANNDENVLVYKNANNQITVNCLNALESESLVNIYNALGQKLVMKQLKGTITVIDTPLVSGAYFVSVINSGKTITKKVILN